MDDNKLKAFVTKADTDQIVLKVLSEEKEQAISLLGFVKDKTTGNFVLTVANDTEKGVIFGKLRDIEVCFSSGKEWSPAEVFEYLRELQFVNGEFLKVAWSGPNSTIITSN